MTVSSLYEDAEYVTNWTSPLKHPQRMTIQHWQLRDLLCAPSTGEFLAVHQNAVHRYDIKQKKSEVVLGNLSFSPTSMTAAHGYIAAGGQRSQLVVRREGCVPSVHQVGGSINNALHISKHGGETRLLVSNNDNTIKVYSLPEMNHIENIGLLTAVNYTSVSPDGTKFIAVGDSHVGWLYDIRGSVGGYQEIATCAVTPDSSFSCAWNHASDKFAVASQDGVVSVWDVRTTRRPIARFTSKQHPQVKGACRAVKFSPSSSVDLLIFTEHTSYLHVVDARTFNEKQVIRVASHDTTDVHIAGTAFSPDSRSLFVGTEGGVLEYSVDTVARRRFGEGSLI